MKNKHDANAALWTRPGLRLVNTHDIADFHTEEDAEITKLQGVRSRHWVDAACWVLAWFGLVAVAGALAGYLSY